MRLRETGAGIGAMALTVSEAFHEPFSTSLKVPQRTGAERPAIEGSQGNGRVIIGALQNARRELCFARVVRFEMGKRPAYLQRVLS